MLTALEKQRYDRQMRLPHVGDTGQQKLKQARILVIGAGGLSASLLPSLVGSGVGFIRLYDADRVDLSNLHRQTLYHMADIGQAKVKAAKQHLNHLNPEVVVETFTEYLHSVNIMQAMDDIDLVVDAADRFATTYLLSDWCFKYKIPLVSASVLAEQGYVGAFCGRNFPSYAAVFSQLPEKSMSCAVTGVLPTTVAVLASLQAHMVINLLLDLKPSALGQLIQVNLNTWHIQRMNFQQAPEPEHPLLWLDEFQIQSNDRVLDFRTPDEIKQAFAPQVEYIALDRVASLVIDAATQRLVCVCASGIRAAKAANILKQTYTGEIYIAAAL